jgi:hypothetical protein
MAAHKTQWPLLISSRLVRHDVQPSRVSVDDVRFTVDSSLFAGRDRKGADRGVGGFCYDGRFQFRARPQSDDCLDLLELNLIKDRGADQRQTGDVANRRRLAYEWRVR